MGERQVVYVNGMLTCDGQFGIAVVEQGAPQQARIHPKVLSPQAALDRDLPQAGRTEQEFVF